MEKPANAYADLLRKAGLEASIPVAPQVFVAMEDSWTDIVIRYLVGARERRKWKSDLTLAAMEALARPEIASRVHQVYPRQQLQWVRSDGRPVDSPLPE